VVPDTLSTMPSMGAASSEFAVIETELREAQAAVVEHRHNVARRARAADLVNTARREVAVVRSRLTDEAADVARLESLSLVRVWASLRGDRDERLDRERAEQQAAQYAVATAEARLAAAGRDLADVDAALADLGDVDARLRRALEAKETWLRSAGGATAAQLAVVARETGRLWAERTEIAEARTAAARATEVLDAAAEHLRSANGWSTYDTFFDGGMIASMVKHDKLDRAAALMREADAALRHLSVELGDLGEQGVGELGIDGMTRTFDVWFDNIFTDLSVRNRIAEARDRVHVARTTVGGVAARLDGRLHDVEARLTELAAQRERVLLG
jgi:hypothetical protein